MVLHLGQVSVACLVLIHLSTEMRPCNEDIDEGVSVY